MRWPTVALSEALESAEIFTDGDWVESRDQDPEGDVRLIQMADVGVGHYLDRSARFLTSETARRLKCTYLKAGDLLVSRMPDPLGRCCIFPGDAKPSVTVVDVCVIRPDVRVIEPRWLMHCLNSPTSNRRMTQYATGTTRARISRKNLGRVKVQLPPLDEQRRIAGILDRADVLRFNNRRTLSHFDDLAASIFNHMFGDPVSNPKHWPTSRLEDQVASMQYGPRFYNESYSPHGVRIVRITDLDYRGQLDFDAMPRMEVDDEDLKKFSLTPGDIVFARTGATVGKLAVIRDGDPQSIAGAYFIRIRLRDGVEPDYVAAALRSPSIQSIIVSGSHQSAQQNFSGPGLRALVIPVPPTDLQRQFSIVIAALAERAVPRKSAASQLDTLFASLQYRAFSGQL